LRATAVYSVSLISVLLPEPLTPVTQVSRPTGISTSTPRPSAPRRLLPRAPHDAQPEGRCAKAGGRAALLGHLDAQHVREVAAGQRIGVVGHLLRRALGHHAAAVHTGARAHVHHVVGGADHVLVVLHHQHAVAQVAQVLQGADEAFVVALVQADAGLVQHVHHALRAAADLAGQADALRLAAAERVGAAVQAQVVQAHVVEEAQPAGDLAHDLVGDLGLGAHQLQALEVGQRIGQRGVLDFVDGLAAGLIRMLQEHVPRLAPQARALALHAGLGRLVAGQLFAHGHRVGLLEAAREVGDDAFEGWRA
jgi:hypothetical protein